MANKRCVERGRDCQRRWRNREGDRLKKKGGREKGKIERGEQRRGRMYKGEM